MKKAILIILSIISLPCICILVFIYQFTVSDDNYAEYYEVELTKAQLIRESETIKKTNPSYQVWSIQQNGDSINPDGAGEYKTWNYFLYFYLEEEDYTLLCIVREKGLDHSIIILRSISQGKNFASWKTINSESLDKKVNERIKKKFEDQILNNLGRWKRKCWLYGVWNG